MNLWIYEFIFESTALSPAQQNMLWLQQHSSRNPTRRSQVGAMQGKPQPAKQWGYPVTFYATIEEKPEAFPTFFLHVKKIAARSRYQHGDEYPGLPGKVLLCSWSFCTAYLTATTQFCQHSAPSWLVHSMTLICCQCIMESGFCLYTHMHTWHRAPWHCMCYNLCFDLFPLLALIRLQDFLLKPCYLLKIFGQHDKDKAVQC